MNNWAALFSTKAAARRYLATIADPAQRAAVAAQLDLVDDVPLPVTTSRPPTSNAQHALPLTSGPGLLLTLPYPPSVNAIWRAVVVRIWKGGNHHHRARIRLSSRGRAYRLAVLQACANQGHPTAPAGRLAVTIEIHAPDRRIRDISNVPKAVEDALTHARVWADDSLIDELHLYRRTQRPGGALIVHIEAMVQQ
ncbi:RusA family crossover junction endodeoxyribonuclease [Deinococcus arboris]|nr:RusA family crossover junction endodeoxyribonuclease [Deinococcus arboris]